MFKYLPNILLRPFDFSDGHFHFIFIAMFLLIHIFNFLLSNSLSIASEKIFKQINFITINFMLFIKLEHFIVNSYRYVYESFWFFIKVFVLFHRGYMKHFQVDATNFFKCSSVIYPFFRETLYFETFRMNISLPSYLFSI